VRLGTLAIRDNIIAFVTFLRSFIFVLSRGVLPSQFKSFELAMEELVEFAEVRLFLFTWLTHVGNSRCIAYFVTGPRRVVGQRGESRPRHRMKRLSRADMMQMVCRGFKYFCSSVISHRCVGCG
jgi:hypothetical protein